MLHRVALGLAVVLLAGCAGTSERIAGWYVTRTLDGYFDFESAQHRQVRANVDETIALLRRSELPHWITFMREVRQGIHEGLSEDSLTHLQRRYDDRLDVSVQVLTPRVAPVLAGLSAKQVEHFTRKVHSDLRKTYDELELAPEKRGAKLEQKAIDGIEDLVGSLSDPQDTALRKLIRSLPSEREASYRSAKAHVDRFGAFLRSQPTQPAIEAELHAMWDHRYDALGPGHDKAARRAVQRRWMLAVYQLLTPAQRQHAQDQLSDRIRSLKKWVLPPA
jgi:Family of unknown function (DUF6279)